MKISEILKQNKVTLSFEVFPPKKEENMGNVLEAAKEIAALKPDFMSVTYGAGGTTRGYTLEVAAAIKRDYGVTVLPHLTSISSTKQDVKDMISTLRKQEIDNLMALRGDIPKDGIVQNDYSHASDMIADIRTEMSADELSIGAACYPEGHVESENKAEDLAHLKEKVSAGVDFLTTQMFFDNNIFYNFLYRIRETGIEVPVLAGIMPITNAKQLSRAVILSGTNVPEPFRAIVDKFGNDPEAMKQAGIIYASQQIIDLIANGVRHIHVYSMNKPDVAEGILRNVSACLL